MSLQPQSDYVIPAETAKVAKAIFPKGSLCITMADQLGSFLSDEDFKDLFSSQGQPCASPGRLALVTILQFVEGLSDRQAAAAMRSRIDWKYLLCLELSDPGVDHTVLSEFRTRLIREQAERLIFEKLLSWCQNQGWLKPRSRQRTDSTHVLASIRAITRLECVGETLRATLNALAVVAPGWLKSKSQPEWVERYSDRIEDYHLYPYQKPSENKKRCFMVKMEWNCLMQFLPVVAQIGYVTFLQ